MSLPSPTSATSPPIWVLAERAGPHIQKVTFELLGDARKLAGSLKCQAEAVVLCEPEQTTRLVDELRPAEPGRVHVLEHAALRTYSTDAYVAALEPLIAAGGPFLILAAATANGRDLAARLAARAGLAYFPHVLTLRAAAGKLEVTRVTHGGGVHAQSIWGADARRPVLATMRPGVADAAPPRPSAAAPPVVRYSPEIAGESRVRVLEVLPADPRVQDLREAQRIVSGGRGVGGPEGFALVEELAAALHASVGASRVAVDLGWIPYERQVGQTGKTVTPELYVAAGISGASHHLMGMRGSEKIVAINSDRKAPIFSVAHFGVVGNLHELLPSLARRIREPKGPARG